MTDGAPAAHQSEATSGITLVVAAEGETTTGSPALTLAGRRWVVTEHAAANSLSRYSCISYSWGSQRVPHPFAPDQLISARALQVMDATVRACHPEAIWLDALCVPVDELARTATLRKMGAIYSGAEQVVVVLSGECGPAIEQINATGVLDRTALAGLAADEWVTRAWTYQECANSVAARFCAERGSEASISGEQLLNAVGQALADYRKGQGTDAFVMRRLFPALDSLEDALADWMLGGLAERTAYQVMAAVGLRSPEATAEDRLNAMIGAVDPEFVPAHSLPGAHPASLFMQACEAKGDYSFIYTSAERSSVSLPGRSWQPVRGSLPAVLPWHSFGEGQRGEFRSEHLELHGMAYGRRGALSLESAQFVADWLGSGAVAETREISARVLERLRQMGFSGSGAHVELEQGLFFPQRPALRSDAAILVATGLRWVHGAPALALLPGERGTYAFGDVGVFVGPVPHLSMSVSVV